MHKFLLLFSLCLLSITSFCQDKCAQLYFEQQYELSYKCFKKSLKSKGISIYEKQMIEYSMGYAAWQFDNPKKADKHFRKVLEIGSCLYSYYFGITKYYLDQGDISTAHNLAVEAQFSYPEESFYKDIYKYIVEEKINPENNIGEKGIAFFDKATLLISDPPSFLYEALGSLYYENKQVDKANKAFKKAIEINSKSYDALFNLGVLYFNEAGKLIEKEESYILNEDFNEQEEVVNDLLKNALIYLEQALSITVDDFTLLTTLKQIYYTLQMEEDYNKVVNMLEEIKTEDD